jgi:hypothetical protein
MERLNGPHGFDVGYEAPNRPYICELEVLILQQVVSENRFATNAQPNKSVKILWHSICASILPETN